MLELLEQLEYSAPHSPTGRMPAPRLAAAFSSW